MGGETVFLALAKRVITALCLMKPLIYLNKEEAKGFTTVESPLLIGGGRPWPAFPGLSSSQAQLVSGGSHQAVKHLGELLGALRGTGTVPQWLRGLEGG